MIEFYKSNGVYYIRAEDQALVMDRKEAEDLFVDIGIVLRDEDMEKEKDVKYN